MRGIRGAITVISNDKSNILEATSNLINELIEKNQIKKQEIVSMIFTATADLDQEYPAVAARKLGYTMIPLMCYQELSVEKSLNKCIRILVYINRNCKLEDISHVYLRKAKKLRPDLISKNNN